MIALPRRRRASPAAASILLLGATACTPDPSHDLAAPADLNVVVILLDTVGAEHVGAFGADTDHTPRIDRLADEGVRFPRAYSPAPWTPPAVASLFTAKMPFGHGLMSVHDTLASEQTTLAERLSERGFVTAGFITHFAIRNDLGFGQGFDTYDDSAVGGHAAITSDRVTDAALDWLSDHAADRFFLFVHYFDAHYRYHHHPQFDLTSSYAGSLEPATDIWKLRERRFELTRADLDYLVGLHREEIAFADHHIGRLVDRIAALGLDERTLVVLAADHGEEFMRHGWIGHTRTLYEELLHIPFLIRLPGTIEPATVDAPVSLIDVMPTVLELVGASAEETVQGRSLVPLLLGEAAPGERTTYGEVTFSVSEGAKNRFWEKTAYKTAVRSGRHKLIHDLLTEQWELYDLEADPEELVDLAGGGHPAEERLSRALRDWELARDEALSDRGETPREISPEERERLRSLGYLR